MRQKVSFVLPKEFALQIVSKQWFKLEDFIHRHYRNHYINIRMIDFDVHKVPGGWCVSFVSEGRDRYNINLPDENAFTANGTFLQMADMIRAYVGCRELALMYETAGKEEHTYVSRRPNLFGNPF